MGNPVCEREAVCERDDHTLLFWGLGVPDILKIL